MKIAIALWLAFPVLGITQEIQNPGLLKNEDKPANQEIISLVGAEQDENLPFVIVSDSFIKEKIWSKLLKETKSKPDLKMPKIVFLSQNKEHHLGEYFRPLKEASIFKFEIYKEIKNFYEENKLKFSTREWNILILNVIAHELLHHLYWERGIDPRKHHTKMRDDKMTELMCEYLEKELTSDKTSCQLIDEALKYTLEHNLY